MSSEINITRGMEKNIEFFNAKRQTAKRATAKAAIAKRATAKAATAKAATAKAAIAKVATTRAIPIAIPIPKVLAPIPTLQTRKIEEQKDVDAEDITGDDGEKVFKKVKKVREDSEDKVPEDSKVNEESEVKTGPDSIDSLLKNTETTVQKLSDLVSKLIKFIKKSLKIKELKKVFFMIFMAIAMAILFMGLNILFGKVIL
jgi:hypothetical protein